MTNLQLGKLESVRGISPAFLQRAAFVAVLSFVFFIAMMVGFYIRQNVGYFLLATAFLIVQILTLLCWLMQRRNEFRLYENGFTYKNKTFLWDEIEAMSGKVESRLAGAPKINFEIRKANGEKIFLTEAVHGVEDIVARISEEIARRET